MVVGSDVESAGRATYAGTILAQFALNPQPIVWASPVTPVLTPHEQTKANAALLELWEHPDGLWNYSKVRSVTVAQVQKAVDDGADVNAKDKDGWTALMIATDWNSMTCIEYLVSKGADVNAKDKDGWTVLMHAARRPSWRPPDGTDVLCIKYLVNKGADVNAKDKDDWTALLEAADSGNLACVKYLVEKGVDVNAKDNVFGMTALSIARKLSFADVAAYLKTHGATK